LSQIAKGFKGNGDAVRTNKPEFIRKLVQSWPDESTIIWCIYNREQDELASYLPEAGSMSGDTPDHERERMIEDFQSGKLRTLISKSKVLGFGLNLERATRQIFSGLVDSYEGFHQCVKRSNRVGSTRPLNVHIPITSVERAMVETVLRKADMVQKDSEQQEAFFKRYRHVA
jgi:superfamily II DNA/RNA helicase